MNISQQIKELSNQIFLVNQLINNRVNVAKNMTKMENLRIEKIKLQNKQMYGI